MYQPNIYQFQFSDYDFEELLNAIEEDRPPVKRKSKRHPPKQQLQDSMDTSMEPSFLESTKKKRNTIFQSSDDNSMYSLNKTNLVHTLDNFLFFQVLQT